MNQMLLALLGSMLSSKGEGMDFSKLLGAISNNNGESNDKMNLLMNLLPQIMNVAKPMRKEDKYFKEAEAMYGSVPDNNSSGNLKNDSQNLYGNASGVRNNLYENRNCSANQDLHHRNENHDGITRNQKETFEEIKGFSTNEVNNALYALMNNSRY